MNINELLSTKERIKILRQVLYKTESLSVNKIAKETKLSKGLVSKLLEMLSKAGIARRANSKLLIQDNLKTKAIKILLNLDSFDTKVFAKHRFVVCAGIYGSMVKGKNTEDSDIDLWVFAKDAKEEELAKLTRELKEKHANINPLYLTKKKLEALKKEDTVFYHSLIFGSITVYGEDLEAV